MGGERHRSALADRETDEERLARLLQPGPRHARAGEIGSARAAPVATGGEPGEDDRPTPEDPSIGPREDRVPGAPDPPPRLPDPDVGGLRQRFAGWRFAGPQLAVVAVIVLVGVLLATWGVLRARPVTIASPRASATATASADPTDVAGTGSGSPTPTEVLKVHVLGAVAAPGVVALPAGARVEDAIAAAGGLTGRARLGTLNLAQQVTDGQQVYIAGKKAARGSSVNDPGATGADPSGDAGADGSGPVELINLNTATAEELEELPGVGPVTAGAILSWREEHGSFSMAAELQEVDGIGPQTYADLEPLVTV